MICFQSRAGSSDGGYATWQLPHSALNVGLVAVVSRRESANASLASSASDRTDALVQTTRSNARRRRWGRARTLAGVIEVSRPRLIVGPRPAVVAMLPV